MSGRVPLPDVPVLVEHGDAVGAAVDDGALVRALPDDLLERHRVGQRHPGVPGEQLEQLELDVAERAAAVERVQRAVGAAADVRQGKRDRVQAGQRGPDQVVEPARLAGRHHHGLAGPQQLADQAARQRGDPAAEPGGQPGGGDQAEPVLLDQHEAARVGAGQLAQAGGDPVEHRLQVALGVHVGDHVAEAAHNPRPLGHVMPGDVILAGLVADVDPADHVAAGIGQRAGVDAHVDHEPVLADPPGGEGDLPATADPLEDGVVLGGALLGDRRRLEADHLFGRPAEHPLRRRVPEHDGAVGAVGHDRVSGALDNGASGRVDPVLAAPPHGLAGRGGPRSASPRWVRLLCHHTFMVPPGTA